MYGPKKSLSDKRIKHWMVTRVAHTEKFVDVWHQLEVELGLHNLSSLALTNYNSGLEKRLKLIVKVS